MGKYLRNRMVFLQEAPHSERIIFARARKELRFREPSQLLQFIGVFCSAAFECKCIVQAGGLRAILKMMGFSKRRKVFDTVLSALNNEFSTQP